MKVENYSPPKPPIRSIWLLSDFHNASEARLQAYFDWYMAGIPTRISQLSDLVRTHQGFQDWSPTFRSPSLNVLGAWVRDNAPLARVLNRDGLAALWGGITFDIGIYWGEILRKEFPQLSYWSSRKVIEGHKEMTYGQPVLIGFGHGMVNPVTIVGNTASQIADGRHKPSGFHDVYQVWAQLVRDEFTPSKIHSKFL